MKIVSFGLLKVFTYRILKFFLPQKIYKKLTSSDVVSRIAYGSIWSFFGTSISRIIVLLTMILVARSLGDEKFGELGTIQAFSSMVGVLMGMVLGNTLTRFIAQHSIKDPIKTGKIIALLLTTSTFTVISSAFLIILFSDFLSKELFQAPHLEHALQLSSILVLSSAFRGIQNGIFSGLEKFELIAKLNIFDSILAVFLILSFLYLGVDGVILGASIAAISASLLGQVFLKRELSQRGIKLTIKGCWENYSILISYSLPGALAVLVTAPVLWYAMILVSQSPNGFAEVGVYNAAYQFHGPMIFIPMIFTSVSIPVLVQEWESDSFKRFLKVYFGIVSSMLAVSIPLVLILSFSSPWIMSLYGPGFSESWWVLVLLLVAAPFHGLSKISDSTLYAMNKAWHVFWIKTLWGSSLIIITMILANEYGSIGLSLAFFISYLIVGFLSMLIILQLVKNKTSSSSSKT